MKENYFFIFQSWSTTDMTGHPGHGITRRAGHNYPPPGPGPVPAPAPPTGDHRATVSPRTDMMGKMNNIADFVLGSTTVSPKQQLTGLENTMGRMNIGQLTDVNKNKADMNGSAYNDNAKVKHLRKTFEKF